MSEFEQIEKGAGGGGPTIDDKVVSVHKNGEMGLLVKAYRAMGEPTAVKIYTDGKRLAIEPSNKSDRHAKNAYIVSITQTNEHTGSKSGMINTEKIVQETKLEREARYEIYKDDETGYWIVDPENEW